MIREVAIVSGKGGTGKSTITLGLASLLKDKAVFVDADVDAPDMYIVMEPELLKKEDFEGPRFPVYIPDKCTGCGLCEQNCRFDAIKIVDMKPIFNEFKCDGCGVCWRVCPFDAIEVRRDISGEIYISRSRFGPFVHARLFPGRENSGKLVSRLRVVAKAVADDAKKDLIILDGPPGVGCPVISTITGVSLTVGIVEPTLSGIHDIIRVYELSTFFNIPFTIVINKSNINPDMAQRIKEFASENGIKILGEIPFSRRIVEALLQRKTIIEGEVEDGIKEELKRIWNGIQSMLSLTGL